MQEQAKKKKSNKRALVFKPYLKGNLFDAAALRRGLRLILYFLMFAFKQQQLSGQEVPVYLSGLITGNSEIVKLCERYIKRICFIKPNGSLDVDISLSQTPFHYYYIPYRALS